VYPGRNEAARVQEFEGSLHYIVSSTPAWDTKDTVSKTTTKQTNKQTQKPEKKEWNRKEKIYEIIAQKRQEMSFSVSCFQ
jgi:hypothetical protein